MCAPGNVLDRARAYQIQSVADFYYQYKLVLRCLFFRSNWNCKLNVNDFVAAAAFFLPLPPPSHFALARCLSFLRAGIADRRTQISLQHNNTNALRSPEMFVYHLNKIHSRSADGYGSGSVRILRALNKIGPPQMWNSWNFAAHTRARARAKDPVRCAIGEKLF